MLYAAYTLRPTGVQCPASQAATKDRIRMYTSLCHQCSIESERRQTPAHVRVHSTLACIPIARTGATPAPPHRALHAEARPALNFLTHWSPLLSIMSQTTIMYRFNRYKMPSMKMHFHNKRTKTCWATGLGIILRSPKTHSWKKRRKGDVNRGTGRK